MKPIHTLAPLAAMALGTLTVPLLAQDAPRWQPVPLISAAMRRAGISPGGEGAQAIRTVVVSPSDPNFLLMGTDVGGIYRSLDEGGHWQVCTVGWNARGANSFAIDPRNPRRIIGAAGNGGDWDPNWGPSPDGLYLSTDQGASWKPILPVLEGNEWRADALAYDPASYDPVKGYCTVAYWESRDSGLYKTTDGGQTWSVVNKDHSTAILKVHPTKGYVYLAHSFGDHPGLYRSTDGGVTFTALSTEATFGLDVVPTRPDVVYATRPDSPTRIWVSDDSGLTFRPVGAGRGLGTKTPFLTVKAGPLDPKNLLCNYGGDHWYDSFTFSSKDGGENWRPVTYDRKNQLLPFMQPGTRFVFSPNRPGVVYASQGNGTVVRSVDGGATFQWRNNGENAVMLGASFNFNPKRPDAVFLSFQDFQGSVTRDGGQTWDFTALTTNLVGGWDYGGYTTDGRLLWCGDGTGWTGPRTLKVSRDGGKNWTIAADSAGKLITFSGQEVGCADPTRPGVCFEANWRSTDQAHTWTPMTGCDVVYVSTPDGKSLFGRHADRVCRSDDGGATWADITPTVNGGLHDVAYDVVRRRLYAASEDRVKAYDLAQGVGGAWTTLDNPQDQRGNRHVVSVCVDPQDPAIVYAAGPANIYTTSATVVRSTDAGKTWENLTVTTPLRSVAQAGGPHEVEWVRVNPATRELWAAGECYGMWKIGPPVK